QNQALAALLFLYRRVLGVDLPWLDDLVRVARPQRLPVVLSREEVRAVLLALRGTVRLILRSALRFGPPSPRRRSTPGQGPRFQSEPDHRAVWEGRSRSGLPPSGDRPTSVANVNSSGYGCSTTATSEPEPDGWRCRMRSGGSTPTRGQSGPGSGCLRRHARTSN